MISRLVRGGLPSAIARVIPISRAAAPEELTAAEELIEQASEFDLVTAIRRLPASAAVLADAASFPTIYRASLMRSAAAILRLEKALARPGMLAGRSEIYVLSTQPHRNAVRDLSAALPGARVRSVINDWLPDLMATSGLFPIAPAELARADEPAGGRPGPDIRYMVFALPRSGSYYLCELLHRAGLGIPKEHLRPTTVRLFRETPGFRPLPFADRLVRQTSRNGYFGTKLIAHYLIDVTSQRYSRLHMLRRWIDRFEVRPIYLERRDLALQAVSAVVAIRRNSWRLVDPSAVENLQPPAYAYDDIFHFYHLFRQHRRSLEGFLDSLGQVHRLAYEDLDADPLPVLNGVMGFLDAPRLDRLPAVETLKVRNDATLEYAERFRAELRARGEVGRDTRD